MKNNARYGTLAAWLFVSVYSGAAIAARGGCLALDGDTLVCNRQKIRLTNVYAPEMNEAGGVAAKRRLQAIVRSGEIRLSPHGHDRYGRMLAEVFVNGRRIEQGDIGPRAGRGSQSGIDRHEFARRQRERAGRLPVR